MEGEKLERRERDFENGRGRHEGERKIKYASGCAGALQLSPTTKIFVLENLAFYLKG